MLKYAITVLNGSAIEKPENLVNAVVRFRREIQLKAAKPDCAYRKEVVKLLQLPADE
jgi:hypothetical protein